MNRLLALSLVGALLAGCQATPVLKGGRPSALSKENTGFLRQLTVEPVEAVKPAYGELTGCTYRSVRADAQGRYSDRTLDLSVRRARDRLLVRIDDKGRSSTALIGSDGEMYDFNLAGFGQLANADTFEAVARKQATALKAKHGVESHVINELALYFPHYSGALKPGATVATVSDEGGRTWARYVYRGMAEYEGRRLLVLDLIRQSEAEPDKGERTIGFALVDPRHAAPVLVAMDSIQKLQLRQIRCA